MVTAVSLGAGGLGLFLLGMVVMTRGLRALADDTIQRLLARFTKSPSSGAVTGALATAVVQSSSATTVAAVGFVGAGLLSFPQALGVIFGANIGTTITGWLVAILGFKLKIGELAMPLVLVGVLLHLFAKRRMAAAGMGVAGFGLVFVGIEALQSGMAGLEGVVTPDQFPSDTLVGRGLLVLIGVVITLVTQSSSAGVATALAAVSTGAIAFPQAAAMVIGMDVGTTVTAAVAAIGGSTDARRTGFAHVIYNLLTGVGAFLLLTPFTLTCEWLAPGSTREHSEIALVAFHTTFNTLGVIAVIPFSRRFAELITRMVPERPMEFTQHLDKSLIESPAVAMEAARATLEEIALAAIEQTRSILQSGFSDHAKAKLDAVSRALVRTNEFLEELSEAADPRVRSRQVAAMHVVDHLRRLADRCQQASRIESLRTASVFSPHVEALRQALTLVVDSESPSIDAAKETLLQNVCEQFEVIGKRLRKSLIHDAAEQPREAEATIAKLDAARWLRRVTHHLWRIVHHLRRLPGGLSPTESELMPRHREFEIED